MKPHSMLVSVVRYGLRINDPLPETKDAALRALSELEEQLEAAKVEIIDWKLAKADSDREIERLERDRSALLMRNSALQDKLLGIKWQDGQPVASREDA